MNDEQKAAYVMAQAACALIEAQGMVAVNKTRELRGESLAYVEEDFMAVINKYGIDHNSVLGTFYE